jgi:hypothetical protein
MQASDIVDPETSEAGGEWALGAQVLATAKAIKAARNNEKEVVLFMGAHPIKLGMSHFLINLIRAGYITHVAGNGAVLLHDYELSIYGKTSESVEENLPKGQFGLWGSCVTLNNLINRKVRERGMGLGESVGTALDLIGEIDNITIAGNCDHVGIPFTIHPLVGGDIFHMVPNADGAALGEGALRDFHSLVDTVTRLEGGVFLNMGSAVTGPELFLKALSMARNVDPENKPSSFTTANFDLNYESGMWWYAKEHQVEAPKDNSPEYYNRAGKSVLYRAGLGCEEHTAIDVQGDFRSTIPMLYKALMTKEPSEPVGDEVEAEVNCDDSGLSGQSIDA